MRWRFATAGIRRRREIYLRRDRVKPLLQVFLPMVAYVAAVPWLGLYVASALFIAGFMWWHGGYRWRALPTGIAVCAVFYVVLEVWFQVDCTRGPSSTGWSRHAATLKARRWNRFTHCMHGFAVALTPYHLLLMVVGVLLGILVGVLPGLGAPNGVSLLLPLTFTMDAGLGDHPADQHVLGRAVRRLDDVDPVQHSRRAVVGRDHLRRLSDGAARARPARR